MSSEFWEWLPAATTLKEWQTAISAGAGFCAVALTLIVNARLALAAEKRQRRHERMALRTAFETELSFLKQQAAGTAAGLLKYKDDPKTGSLMRVALETPVYSDHSGKLPALTGGEIREILGVYLYLRTASDRLLLLSKRVHISENVSDDLIDIPKHAVKIAIANMNNIAENADRAVREIARARRREKCILTRMLKHESREGIIPVHANISQHRPDDK